jgi:hypothetical protein
MVIRPPRRCSDQQPFIAILPEDGPATVAFARIDTLIACDKFQAGMASVLIVARLLTVWRDNSCIAKSLHPKPLLGIAVA